MADLSAMVSDGGQTRAAVAAGTLAETVAVTGAGRLCRVTCLTAGTASLAIWDSITTTGDGAANSVLLYATTATFAAGDTVNVQIPFTRGLLPKQVTNTPGVLLTFSNDRKLGI